MIRLLLRMVHRLYGNRHAHQGNSIVLSDSGEFVVLRNSRLCSLIRSVGMVAYELATGEYPFSAINSFPALFDWLCNKDPPRLDANKWDESLCHCATKLPAGSRRSCASLWL